MVKWLSFQSMFLQHSIGDPDDLSEPTGGDIWGRGLVHTKWIIFLTMITYS